MIIYKKLTLTAFFLFFGSSGFAALTPEGCVESDLNFLNQLEERARSKDESLLEDETIFQTASNVLVRMKAEGEQPFGGYYLANYMKALNFPSCEALRSVDPKFTGGLSGPRVKDKFNYKNSTLRFGCGKNDDMGFIGCMPGISSGTVYVNSASSKAQKSKAFNNFLQKIADAREEILHVTGVPFSKKYPRKFDGTRHTSLPDLRVLCETIKCD